MSTESYAARQAPQSVDWRRAEFVLTALAFLGFFTLPIRLKTIYSGLPAHPLFVHVPVIMIPVSVMGALAIVAKPKWLDKYGIMLCLCAIVGMSSMFLAMQAGGALSSALDLSGNVRNLISQHANYAHVLAVVFTLFTAILILTFSAHRISGGSLTGLGIADTLLGARVSYLALRVGLVVLALVSVYLVYKVGDLGAKAVWAGKIQAAEAAAPGQ